MPRRHRAETAPSTPVLPFLAIMLGLMSVMALIALAVAVEQREERRQQQVVALVGIPDEFIPLEMRCQKELLRWRDDEGQWRTVSQMGLVALYQDNSLPGLSAAPREARDFRQFLMDKVMANRQLSHGRRQHTILLWVEPEGIELAQMLQFLLQLWEVPVRVGQLPILPRESVGTIHAPR